MVKVASVRESRLYRPVRLRNWWEYINAGLHVFCSVLLLVGLGARLARPGGIAGLYAVVVAVGLIAAVNVHDLVAHVAGLDSWVQLMGMEPQLLIVEIGAPFMHLIGTILTFVAVLFLLIDHSVRLDSHALNLLIAGPVLLVLGSIQNACQVYQEGADAHIQILQKGVYLTFVMGSELWLVGGIMIDRHVLSAHGHQLLGRTWSWLWFGGSALYLIGGLVNLSEVFMMQQMNGSRLEGLRGLPSDPRSELRAPLMAGGGQPQPGLVRAELRGGAPPERSEIVGGQWLRRPNTTLSDHREGTVLPTSYKDALIGQA